jgi:hypothetical protein
MAETHKHPAAITPEVSEAAAMLGRRNKDRKKRITEVERVRRRLAMQHAREFRHVKREVGE